MSDETKDTGSEKVEERNQIEKPTEEVATSISEATRIAEELSANLNANDTNQIEAPRRAGRKAQRTDRKQIHSLLKPTDSEEDLLQTIPEITMAKEKTTSTDQTPENIPNSAELEEKDMEEFLVTESPKLLQRLSDIVRGVWTLIKVFIGFALSIWSKLKRCIPSFIGVTVYLAMCYGVDYFMIPLTYKDLPHYPARLQYISRMAALSLFPVIFSWFVGLSAVLSRLVQSTLRDVLVMLVVHCALVTFLPVEQIHWIFIIMFVTVLFRLTLWFSVCQNLLCVQAASEVPLQLCHITLTLYTFLSILAQELGYMQTPTITTATSDSPDWVYPTMCSVMERLFCGATKPHRV